MAEEEGSPLGNSTPDWGTLHLRDRPSPLLAGPSPDHPEVEFESRNSGKLSVPPSQERPL